MYKIVSASLFLAFVFSGCASNRAIAMNEYHPEKTKVSGATVAITPKMIEEAQRRRAQYLKTHAVE
jgi:PBP1b-binding outer membrane lipoprotein LpoB